PRTWESAARCRRKLAGGGGVPPPVRKRGRVMKRITFVVVALIIVAIPLVAQTRTFSPTFPRAAASSQTAPAYFPERFDWQHKKPEEVGMDAARIAEAVKVSIDRENPASKDLNIALATSF